LYWPLLKPAGALEILAHRMVWSMLVLAVVLAVNRQWDRLRGLTRRQVGLLALAGGLIAVNWGAYIYAVNSGHVIEASLGYFINPLVTIALGVLLLGERLRLLQWIAVGLGTLAVAVLTVDYGRPPWIALALAFSFATYGLLKKRAHVGAIESLSVEALVQVAPALAFVAYLQLAGRGTFTTEGPGHGALLATTGLISTIPLLFFGAAAIRVPLTTLGLLQYLAPVMQFLIGVFVAHEPMPASRVAGFALVWLALALLIGSALTHRRQVRRADSLEEAGTAVLLPAQDPGAALPR
jgi:chloramphenicol-sensitive protein RarD